MNRSYLEGNRMNHSIDSYLGDMATFSLFRGIRPCDLKHVTGCLGAYVKSYKKEEIIHLRGDDIKTIGVVLKGKVQMIQEDMWGNQALLMNVEVGDLFGESFACGSYQNEIVSFVAATDITIIFLPFNRVLHSCSNSCGFHHQLIENVVSLIADKNIQLMEKIDVMSKKSLREKISSYLTLIAEKTQSMEFDIPMGRIQLAGYLHADRSALTRELNRMKEEGIITFEKNHFKILKPLF